MAGAIVVVSGIAVSFLLWLLYVHHASTDFAGRWMFLPALNALLNGLCAIALCAGLYFIKHHNREAHRSSMLLAFAFSSAFLISYIVNHALHGDTIFPGHGPVRVLYLSILASHVILSVVALPMVLTTFFFSLTARFAMHRRIARWTYPIWLYVSITGVVVFVFLRAYAYWTCRLTRRESVRSTQLQILNMLEVQLMPETLYRFSPSKSHRLDVHVRASTRFKLQQEILRGRTADFAIYPSPALAKR